MSRLGAAEWVAAAETGRKLARRAGGSQMRRQSHVIDGASCWALHGALVEQVAEDFRP